MADDKVYLPQQKVKRGIAGYKGKDVVVIDADGKPTTNGAKKKR